MRAGKPAATAIGRDLDRMRAAGGFAGTASKVVEYLGTLSELGVTRVYFQIMDLHDRKHLDFLKGEIVPQIA